MKGGSIESFLKVVENSSLVESRLSDARLHERTLC